MVLLQQMRHKRKEALKEADLVILAGAVCDFRLGYGRSLPKAGKVISVNRDKEKMLLVSPGSIKITSITLIVNGFALF